MKIKRRKRRNRKETQNYKEFVKDFHENPFGMVLAKLRLKQPGVSTSSWIVTFYPSNVTLEEILFDIKIFDEEKMKKDLPIIHFVETGKESKYPPYCVVIEKGKSKNECDFIHRSLMNLAKSSQRLIALIRNVPIGTYQKVKEKCAAKNCTEKAHEI